MALSISRAFSLFLCLFSLSSHATIIVENDWLSSDLAVYKTNDTKSEIISTTSRSYQGATTELDSRILIQNNGFHVGNASERFSIGNRVGDLGGVLLTPVFSGFVISDDEWGIASAVLKTNWTFTTTNSVDYEINMLGEYGGSISFSLFNESTQMIVSEEHEQDQSTLVIRSSGTLDAFNTYTLRMGLDRKNYVGNLRTGDGSSQLYFAISEEFILSDDRTHHPVPEPLSLILLSVGIIGLGFTRKLKKS